MEFLQNEMSKISRLKDERLLVLFLHLNVEYWLNELIVKAFPKPKRILEMRFSSKLEILKSLGIISDTNSINNIKKLNEIRNNYAHTLDYKSIRSKVEEKISEMREVTGPPDFEKIGHVPCDPLTNLWICILSTIVKLSQIRNNRSW